MLSVMKYKSISFPGSAMYSLCPLYFVNQLADEESAADVQVPRLLSKDL